MSMIRTCAVALALSLPGVPVTAWAGPTACPAQFLNGSAPELRKPNLSRATREICYSGFAVLHSGVTRTALWSAERLTRERVANAREMERENTFHPDPFVPSAERSELSDYVRSGFDRGHLAPSGDMPDPKSQDESFTLANMIPQDPDNNRGLWADIEKGVRNLATRRGEVYVVTGPIFLGDTLQSLKGRVLIPTQIFKAVMVPSTGEAGAYLVRNGPGRETQLVSIDRIQEITGIDPFPGLSPASRSVASGLPEPRQGGRSREAAPASEHASPAPGLAMRLLRRLTGGW